MRHRAQNQRPKLGHVERRLGAESPDLRGNLGKGRAGMAAPANSWTGISGLDLLSLPSPGKGYWWNCSGISSVHNQGNLELQASLPPGPASLRRYGGHVRNPSFPNFKLPLAPAASPCRANKHGGAGASPQHVYTTQYVTSNGRVHVHRLVSLCTRFLHVFAKSGRYCRLDKHF